MRKILNTLYITDENTYLALDGETVTALKGDEKIGQFPLHIIESIVTFSYKGASPALMGECAERGIGLAFFNPFGKFLCRTDGITKGNVLLRKEQYRISDSCERSCLIARNMILGKVFNSKWSISRTVRDHRMRVNAELLGKTAGLLHSRFADIQTAENLDSLRGIEGECAALYFSIFGEHILNQKDSFPFDSRNKRPPLDNVNAMLSFGYSILANDCANALEGVGLDSYVGFLHRDRPGRKSLALDLMEELRPILVDRFVITLINNKVMSGNDFIKTDSGAVEFTKDGKKKYLTAWQNRKLEIITHPYLKEKCPWGLVPHIQALLLARNIRGDIEAYPPFLWK